MSKKHRDKYIRSYLTKYKQHPLGICITFNHVEMVKLLRSYGMKWRVEHENYAKQRKNKEMLDYIENLKLEHEANKLIYTDPDSDDEE